MKKNSDEQTQVLPQVFRETQVLPQVFPETRVLPSVSYFQETQVLPQVSSGFTLSFLFSGDSTPPPFPDRKQKDLEVFLDGPHSGGHHWITTVSINFILYLNGRDQQ